MKILFSFLFLLLTSQNVWAADSQYTTLDLKQCKMLENSADDPNAEIDYFTAKCPGREGLDVIVSGGDLRSWVILKRGSQEVFDTRISVFENAPGSFPYVGNGKLEWRYQAGKLTGLILRVAGQSPNEKVTHDVSHLLAYRHNAGTFCFLGTATTNEAARALVDGPQSCK